MWLSQVEMMSFGAFDFRPKPCPSAAPCVIPTEARARWGEGLRWGCTVKPLVGDTRYAVQPQVSLTSGRAHTRAAPGDAPGYHIYVCMWCTLEQVPMCVMGLHGHGQGAQHLLHTLSP